ncbi:MAG: DNA helicase UvrBC [Candidatus Poribacteria bacterium]|nr:DNA helicase UvrBC [Candidatus Poribacteria bacterium]MDD9973704.1 DNA helicase UvrBC [Candidatus Poribacteria bacterium]MDE0324081.1 DNA helicase UvrBC [Candidatus Poribacteria bacterium]
MANDSIQRNTRWVQTFDRILEMLNLDPDRPVSVLQIEDGREVVVVQPNAFTISRIYATGRPDGMRPHGMDSYYDYFFAKLKTYEEEHNTHEGFQLESEEWEMLFEESFHRYTRYLLFAGIKRWKDVRRDTATNIAVTNLARQCAPSEIAWRSYQYKGYMLMMHSIANAELSLQEDDTTTALQHIDTGIRQIGEFCGECLREEHGEAENITRERYLSNLIEFRSDLESLDTEETDAESDEEDILAELERLLNEEDA